MKSAPALSPEAEQYLRDLRALPIEEFWAKRALAESDCVSKDARRRGEVLKLRHKKGH